MKNILVITGPSGVGKDTFLTEIEQKYENAIKVVTTVSRAPRSGEIDGENHYFVSQEQFMAKIANNEFLEYAEVYGNYYGITKAELKKAPSSDFYLICRTDVQGAESIMKLNLEADICVKSLFILPERLDYLPEMLKKRGLNTPAEIELRVTQSKIEIVKALQFDFTIINYSNLLDCSFEKLHMLIKTEIPELKRTN